MNIFHIFLDCVPRKTESVSFPDHLTKSLSNLVQFVLRHASRSVQINTGLSVCSYNCLTQSKAKVVTRLSQLQAISHVLTNSITALHAHRKQLQDSKAKDTSIVNHKMRTLEEQQASLLRLMRRNRVQLGGTGQLRTQIDMLLDKELQRQDFVAQLQQNYTLRHQLLYSIYD